MDRKFIFGLGAGYFLTLAVVRVADAYGLCGVVAG